VTTRDESDADHELAEVIDTLPREPDDLPPIDLATFIVSLRTSAMLHLGSGQGTSDQVDLALARQEIDLLGILEEKTRGNLTGEEERLLSQILFDLRTRYLAVRTRASKREV
jgi:hypothetical protein